MDNDIETTTITANGMTFRCRSAGPPDAREGIVLLHGFPETSHMWLRLLPVLADAGYRCIAPDQRGYSPGARPDDVDAYSYKHLASDILAFADGAGFERFHLVGHDWGSLAGWAAVAVDGGKRIASWTAMSVAHPLGFAKAVYEDPSEEGYRQVLQFLLTDGMPEAVFSSDAGQQQLRGTYTFSDEDEIGEYLALFKDPAAIKGAVNWYLASRGHKKSLEDPDVPFGDVTLPTLLIWGKSDPYCTRATLDAAAPYMKGPYRIEELDAGHWLAQERPAEVASAVLAHLRGNAIAP